MDNLKKMMALLVTLNMFVPALAQMDLPDPGILPTSPVYGFKKGWERALDVITFDPESKSQLHYQYALTRLSEANALADLGETEQIDDVIQEYESEMNITEELVNETVSGNETEANNTRGIGKQVSEFMKTANMTWEKHLFVLSLVAQKVPPQAAAKIERNINRTIERKYSNETTREQVRDKLRVKDKSKFGDESGDSGKGNKGNKPEGTPGQPEKPDTGKPSDDEGQKGNKGGSAGGSNGQGSKGSSSGGGGGSGGGKGKG